VQGATATVEGAPARVEAARVEAARVESARVAALHELAVLDTPPEAGSDDLAGLAAQICGMPMALVSLVDTERQWSKARVGCDLVETSRADSFCAHALGSADVLVVPDARLDGRFVDNRLVTAEDGIRAYAGAPLVTPEGHVLGTLCVLDVVPRVLAPEQLAQLQLLARQVVTQLELRCHAASLVAEAASRAAAQAALRDSQRLLDGILAHTDVAVYAKDLTGRFLLTNPAFDQLLGAEPGAVAGRTDHDLFPADVADGFRKHDARVIARGRREVFREEVPHPDGSVHGYLSTKFPLYDDDGAVYALAGVSTDVTELSEARRAHAESEERWRALVEHSPVGVAVIGGDGRFRYANAAALALYGAGVGGDLMGRRALDLVPPTAVPATTAAFGEVLAGGPPLLSWRWQLLRLDGRLVTVEVNAASITQDGQAAVQVELRDVTERAEADAALRASEERFRALFTCSPVGTAECLPDGTILSVNPELLRMLGYDDDGELVGCPASRLLADAEAAIAQERDLEALRGGTTYFAERRYRRRDGSTLPVLVGVGLVRDEEGRPLRLLGSVVDVSDRVAAEEALRVAHEQVEERQAFTEAVLGSIDVGIVACDAEGHLTVFNDATKVWHGMGLESVPTDELLPEQLAETFDLLDADGAPLAPDQVPLLRALRDGVVRDAEMIIHPHGRQETRVLCSGRALRTPSGRSLGAVIAMTDITASRAQTKALQASESRFRTTFTNDPAGLAVLSRGGRPLQVNPALTRLLGRDEDELLRLPDVLALAVPDDRDDLAELCRSALAEEGRTCTTEARLRHPDGRELWVQITVTELPDPSEGSGLLLQVEDIAARRAADERLTRAAQHDSLTDLPNRSMVLARAASALARPRGPGDGDVALLFIDLDAFKAINDTFGHAAGDHLLVEVSRRLTLAMRPSDLVARLGGDEFVVLCDDMPHPREADRIARRLERVLAAPMPWEGRRLEVSASVGVAYGSDFASATELVRAADRAMYDVKRRRRAAA